MKLKTVLITTSLFLLGLVLIVFQDVIYQTFETRSERNDDRIRHCIDSCLYVSPERPCASPCGYF